ncbi:bifunctional diguanylate cyclase/phosphodiesterase [Georhizobium profundi]|uniref:Bifunctional diguanylate cyclase/phosphodiesterase n=1 Tax=Georhizobium profundi TaxID=2341112 RepID=A0A3Q8XS21_9HYPH|nr:bifunctional diguanylate cyclase/phosphodiesterase [Georhizobium profundi]AZN72818.1 bifunctional diguanylate cyclase/phosphodiesterase [Georhizobium profundi]
MGLIATIQRQSRRSYLVSQCSLVGALTATSAIALSADATGSIVATSAAAMAAVGFSMFTLHHARRGVYRKLEHAHIADGERQRMMESDVMTGALARRHFMECLDQAVRRTDVPVTLMLIDIDHFKQLNDTLGHPAGDAALVHLSNCLRHQFKTGQVGRLGGDEFAILFFGTSEAEIARQTALLLQLVAKPFRHAGHDIALSVSIGTATSIDRAHDASGLFQNADLALYASKSAGRGRATTFEESMLQDRRRVRYLQRELRAAIYLDHLELHYQPVVDAQKQVKGFEALVRWRHPVRGLIPPIEFIPVAESSTLIDLLGEWVFTRACQDLARLGHLNVSINVSGEQLKRDNLVAMTERVLQQTGCAPQRIVYEITETAATDATPDVLRRLNKLRAMGIRLALDDFGTGHCGFNYLKTLPIDVIKIDRSYISNLGKDRLAQVLVSALTEVGRIQGISVVAEGVETDEDFQLAKAAGCDRFQGYAIARPQPLEQIDLSRIGGMLAEAS